MQKMTLLDMTQNILSAMNSDEVNSITDTVESQQVAEEIRTAFMELYTNHDAVRFEGIVTLVSPSDTTTPNVLLLPDNVESIKWVKYVDFRASNDDDNLIYKDIPYVNPEDFIKTVIDGPDPVSSVDVNLIGTSTLMYTIPNDRAPRCFTILEKEQALVFDSFDAAHESFLTAASSLVWGTQYETFTMDDSFIPPIPASEFPHLLAEAKSACFINLKEIANSNEASRARRQLVRSQRRRATVPGQTKGILTGVDFSRKR